MVKYKIIFDKEACIGALACMSISPEFFEPDEGTKVNLIKGNLNAKTNKYELMIDEKDFQLNKYAESNCPVNAIEIIKIED